MSGGGIIERTRGLVVRDSLASNFGPVSPAKRAAGDLTAIFDADVPGHLVGQAVHIANNFDNVATQVLTISGSAWRLAAADVMPNPIDFGILHAGDSASQPLTATKHTRRIDGFSELHSQLRDGNRRRDRRWLHHLGSAP